MTTPPTSRVSTGATRARRYCQRRKNAPARSGAQAIAAFVEGGLPQDKRDNDAIERAFYELLNAARCAGVSVRDA
jgi:hypothetical protein